MDDINSSEYIISIYFYGRINKKKKFAIYPNKY